jgi:hypothetical protein
MDVVGPSGSLMHTTVPDPRTTYPDCFSVSGATISMNCVTTVWVGGIPCTASNAPLHCSDWNTYRNSDPGNVKCRFGTYSVPISDCLPLAGAYTWTGQGITTTTQQPQSNPDGSTSWVPNGTPNPSTSPSPSAGPTVSAAPLPTTGSNPGPSDLPSYTPDPPPGTDPVPDPQSQSCWGQGWSWNPISWVYVPTKCALSWAFVPKSPPSFSDVPSPLPPGWIPTLPSLSAGACGPVTFPRVNMGSIVGGVGPVTAMNSCDAPWPTVRIVTYYGGLASGLVTIGWVAFRALQAGLGMSVMSGGDGEDL